MKIITITIQVEDSTLITEVSSVISFIEGCKVLGWTVYPNNSK